MKRGRPKPVERCGFAASVSFGFTNESNFQVTPSLSEPSQSSADATWARGEFEGGLPHLISISCDVGSSTTPASEYLQRIRHEIRACEKRVVQQGVEEP